MKKQGKSKYRFLYRFLLKTGILLTIIVITLMFIICPFRMDDNTMFPSFRNGDLGVFCRVMSIQTNDVVLYKNDDGVLKVGRVVAMEGQTIEFLEDGGYNVDGYGAFEEIPYETYATDVSHYPFILNDGEVFVLNDFRSVETDSRSMGPIDESQIVGKLVFSLRIRGF